MDPVLKAVLLSWNIRISIIIVLALAGTFYSRGWWLLRQKTAASRQRYEQGTAIRRHIRIRHQLAVRWRLVSYWVGLLLIGLALLSPIDVLGGQLFIFHMLQHLLLIMFAPPLLLIANPMPFLLWGLPAGFRKRIGRALSQILHRDGVPRSVAKTLATPGLLWLFWVISLIAWHDPGLYNLALEVEWVHDVEHLTFFIASMLFWWNITGAGPRLHKQFGLLPRTAFVLAAVPPNMALGVILAFYPDVLYTYYLAVPRLWGISVLTDQTIGGVIMWIPGSMMFIIAGLILIARYLQQSGQPHNEDWSNLPPSPAGTPQQLVQSTPLIDESS